jgi:hypothetical protein
MTALELAEILQQEIDDIQARTDAYDERTAIQEAELEAQTRGKSTTDFAVAALQRPERFAGEHDVARAWLRNYDPHVHVFTRLKS